MKEVKDYISTFVTKYPHGFTNVEIEKVLENFPNVNREKFNNAMFGNTCAMIDGNVINYHTDVERAIRCGLENRNLTQEEWD